MASQETRQYLGRLLPSSVNIRRRPPLNANPVSRSSTSNSFRRAQTGQNAVLPLSDENDTNRANVTMPTVSDFLKLKKEFEELQRGILEQRVKVEAQAEQPPFAAERPSEFTSDLSSIAEEDNATPRPTFRIFTSSPNIHSNQNANSTPMSGQSSATATSAPEAVGSTLGPIAAHLIIRSNRRVHVIQDTSNGQDQRPLRRSSRIAGQSGGPPTESNEGAASTEGTSQTRATSAAAADSTVGSQNERLLKHRAELLSLLNTASVKDLQTLPLIGPKTAMALVMHRSVLGEFEDWKQVEKLPIWKDVSWSRFAKAVCIEIEQ
ncbi:kinesin-like protein Nod [Drosophila navojoa]|uniref:kinesin-like protein Nod n=1 Tax=Drosophila navojoa TaxID=7232 RepID=UPI0011BEBF59|nr:kinesin-like protein Nod [Drosophila navojoa]